MWYLYVQASLLYCTAKRLVLIKVRYVNLRGSQSLMSSLHNYFPPAPIFSIHGQHPNLSSPLCTFLLYVDGMESSLLANGSRREGERWWMEQFLAKTILENGFLYSYLSYCSCSGSESPEVIFLVPNCGLHQLAGHSRLYPPVRD